MIDDCGYLYGMNLSGGGINKSVLPVNTPLQSTLTSPANNAIGVSLTPSLTWTHKCIPDSFRLQIALDAAFNYVVDDHAGLIATNYTVGTAVLSSGIKYYWRVYGVNAAGVGKWSTVYNFKTLTALPLTLLSFGGVYRTENNTVQLSWVTANEINTHHFMVERSEDAANFTAIGTLMACNNCGNVNDYRFTDSVVTVNKVYYYRLKIFQANGSSTFSNIIAVKKNQGGQIKLLPNPVTSLSELQIISENNMDAIFQLFDVKGGKIVEEKLVLQKGSNRDIIKTGKLKLSAGVYQAVVITPGGSETFKLVIQ